MAMLHVENIAAYLRTPAAKANWTGPKFGHPVPICIHLTI